MTMDISLTGIATILVDYWEVGLIVHLPYTKLGRSICNGIQFMAIAVIFRASTFQIGLPIVMRILGAISIQQVVLWSMIQ